ncbi:MAG: hypothetical protein HN348_15235 [Proteobacteria bacterium]|jgi:hypothetical protein|nr:hypothetical protein [Pseudomonadota bacterium]
MNKTPLMVILLTGCYPDAPINPNAAPMLNTIAGTVVADGIDEPGNVMVLIFRADNPGPPNGTGSPITIATVSHKAFDTDARGLSSASYAVTGLEDGDYLLTALMDIDGDFNPFVDPLAGATCLDYVGSHVASLTTREPAVVSVDGGVYEDNVLVVIDTLVPIERPAFTLPAETTMVKVDPNPQTYTLSSTGVHTAFSTTGVLDLEGPCTADTVNPVACDLALLTPCETAFYVYAVDNDGDGYIDSHPDYDPRLGLPNIWPRVYVRYLGTPSLDPDLGVVYDDGLPEGEYIASENFPFALELAMGAFPAPVGMPYPLQQLSVTWAPAARHYYPDGTYENVDIRLGSDPASLPDGIWSVSVVLHSGQTWTLPNEIGTMGWAATSADFDPTTQLGYLAVTSESAPQ